MNLSFSESSPQSNIETNQPEKIDGFTEQQLDLLEELRTMRIFRESIKASDIPNYDARCDKLKGELIRAGLNLDDFENNYDRFVGNYTKLGKLNREELH